MKTKKLYSLTRSHADIILDSVTEGVFTVNENMVITYFNKAAGKIIGMPRDKAVGQYCFDVLRSNICETDCPIRFSIETGGETIDRHKNILRVDGKKIPVAISASVLRNENGEMIGGVETLRDLSKIEALENAGVFVAKTAAEIGDKMLEAMQASGR